MLVKSPWNRRSPSLRNSRKPAFLRLGAVVLGVLMLATAAFAEDAAPQKSTLADPFVFILFDTSGSMNWTPPCTQSELDAGTCDSLCPSGDCAPSRDGDDPASKFVQMKEALYDAISQTNHIQFGFATYNQDRLRMRDKHWLYRVEKTLTKPDGSPNFLTLVSGELFPEVARRCSRSFATCSVDADCAPAGGTCEYEDVFGAGWNCDEGSGDDEIACYGNTFSVADMDDIWELRRAQHFAKLGRGPDFSSLPSGEIRDQFDSDSFNNNDGALTWAGPWIESDTAGAGPTAGNARIENGFLSLDDTPNFPGRPSLQREADLTSFLGGAELIFDWSAVGNLETSDTAAVEVSSDGGASWTILALYRNFTAPTSGSATFDISSFVSHQTQIRFRIHRSYAGSDEQFRVHHLEIRPLISTSVIYLRDPQEGRRYKFIYRPVATYFDGSTFVANRYGNATFAVDVEVRLCVDNNKNCASSFVDRQILHYSLVDEFANWDIGANRFAPGEGFFGQLASADGEAVNTCDGWDGNDDSGDDRFPNSAGYLLRFPTEVPTLRFDSDGDGIPDVPDFEFGDVIPMDWEDDHASDILGRLAPNLLLDPLATPDFGIASYFLDERQAGEAFLRLKDENARPLVPDGATPLGSAVNDFRFWFDEWDDIAAAFDQDFFLRQKFLLVLADGDATCPGPSACDGTGSLLNIFGMRTFVVGFGVPSGAPTLNCMAANGGTGDPVYPQNKSDLTAALLQIFSAMTN